MKTVRKALVLAACAIMLVCATIAGTLAYLTAKTSVSNTFTVGNVAITMDETDVDNSTEGQDRDTQNTYKLLPGKENIKDPTITVTKDSEDCYIFVKIDNALSDIEDKTEGVSIEDQIRDSGNWTQVTTGVYYYSGNLSTEGVIASSTSDITLPAVFKTFTVSSAKTYNDLKAYDQKEINVTAYAVQAASFDSATAAWDATFGKPAAGADSAN